MAPEVLSGENYDPTCIDLWSLGIVLLAMETCREPWRRASTRDTSFRELILRGEYVVVMLVRETIKALARSVLL